MPLTMGLLLLVVMLIALIVSVETAWRHVPITRAGPGEATLPLKLDRVTVLPAYLAGIVLMLPSALTAGLPAPTINISLFEQLILSFQIGQPLFLAWHALMLVVATLLATAAVVSPRRLAAGLARDGATIPGIGAAGTAGYLDRLLTRLAVVVAGYMLAVCFAPDALGRFLGIPFHVGGPALMIVVIVMLDIIARARTEQPADAMAPPKHPSEINAP